MFYNFQFPEIINLITMAVQKKQQDICMNEQIETEDQPICI